jgi:hypothetical protein
MHSALHPERLFVVSTLVFVCIPAQRAYTADAQDGTHLVLGAETRSLACAALSVRAMVPRPWPPANAS